MDPDPLQNSRGYFWYYYDDQDGGGNSTIGGLIPYEHSETGFIMDVVGNGREGSNGAYIEFDMGEPYPSAVNPSITINPFVGIGANLYDTEGNANFANVSAFAATGGIYFEYRTAANVEFIDVELADANDVSLGTNGKPVGDNDGEVFFTRLPGTNGQWRAARVPFSAFVLPLWVDQSGVRRQGNTAPEFERLAQLKFKRQGGQGTGGDFAIDNVYFYGGSAWGDGNVSVRRTSNRAVAATGLRATYNRGVVGVNWNTASQVANGKISLVNVKGRTVASAPIQKAGNRITANLGTNRVPAGRYFVRVNAKDVNGKKVVQQVPITIVK